ncbi:MAG: hypothetical protein WBC50_03565 [Dehalococcoidales bacterium]
MKKIGLISMVLVLAMGMLGVGSAWAYTVVAGDTTDTDCVGIRNVSTDDPIGSLDPVWNGDVIYTSEENLASCISTNGDPKCLNGETQFYDSVTETINNAYPGYAPTMTIEVANCGSNTVWVAGFVKDIIAGNEDLMEHFVELRYWSIQKNGVLEFEWYGELELAYFLLGYDDGSPYQLDPGDVVTLVINLLILEESPWVEGWEFPQGETATQQDTFTYTDSDGNIDTTLVTIDLVNLVKNPPGWNKGKKSGWDGSVPPGLEKKDKTPNGFDKGKKAGWE